MKIMIINNHFLLLFIICPLESKCPESEIEYWTTEPWDFGGTNRGFISGDGLINKGCLPPSKRPLADMRVDVDNSEKFQDMIGFGSAMTGSSAWLISKHPKRDEIMQKLFGSVASGGFGISMIRIPVSLLSDFMVEEYTYLSKDNDWNLESFSIQQDLDYFIPILKEAKSINPKIKFIAAAWSAPEFMKTSNSLYGGGMRDDALETYSKYLVKYLDEYKKHGIDINYLIPQNEPLHSANGYPTMILNSNQEANLVKLVWDEMQKEKLNTKIIIYDHNWDNIDYSTSILSSEIGEYVEGVAWHCYGGDYKAPGKVAEQFPTKKMMFTECSGWGEDSDTWGPTVLKWNQQQIIIGQPVFADSTTALLWNIALDESHGPNQASSGRCKYQMTCGCSNCRGLLTLSSDDFRINADAYAVAHSSAFVTDLHHRVKTDNTGSLYSAAYKSNEDTIVVIQSDEWQTSVDISVTIDNIHYLLPQVGKEASITIRK